MSNCTNTNLVLKKKEFDREDLQSKDIEIDTLDYIPGKNICFGNLILNGTFGRFTINQAVLFNNKNGSYTAYVFKDNDSTIAIASKQYISLVHNYKRISGWVYKINGEIMNNLPHIKSILDTIKLTNGIKKSDFSEYNGVIIQSDSNHKNIATFNYGNFITKYKYRDFDSLDYNLYKLSGDSLIIVSNDGNDLVKESDGVFFLPLPGYGVIHMFNKNLIYKVVDSISKLAQPPSILEFYPINR